MNFYKLNIKRYFKNTLFSVLTALLFLGTFGYIIFMAVKLKYFNPLNLPFDRYYTTDFLASTLILSLYSFVFFLFVSYEFFYKSKQVHFDEALHSISSGKSKLCAGSFAVLFLINLVYSVLFFIVNMAFYYIFNINHIEFAIHIFLNILLNVFMANGIAVLTGAACALYKKRMSAYFTIIVLVIAVSPVGDTISYLVNEFLGINIYSIRDFFALTPQNLNREITTFGFSVLPRRFYLLILWAAIMLFLLLFNALKSNKNMRFACCAVCAGIFALSFAAYCAPASEIHDNLDPEKSLAADAIYYLNNEQYDEKGDFRILSYNMKIDIGNCLSAYVEMETDEKDLAEYKFTLYHGYNVKKVLANGTEELEFEQNGDYISVKNNGHIINSISMEYIGSAPKFFSNYQGAFLPGYFPYYPHSGYSRLFSNYRQGFIHILSDGDTKYNIQINSNKKIYCNLNETEGRENCFFGVSDGVSVFSGFYEAETFEDVTVVYPYLNKSEFSTDSIANMIHSYKKQGIINSSIKLIMLEPGTNLVSCYERCCEYSDYITTLQLLSFPEDYEEQKKDVNREELKAIIKEYTSDSQGFMDSVALLEKNKSLYSPLKIQFADAVKSKGGSIVLEQVSNYVENLSDTRTPEQLFAEITAKED